MKIEREKKVFVTKRNPEEVVEVVEFLNNMIRVYEKNRANAGPLGSADVVKYDEILKLLNSKIDVFEWLKGGDVDLTTL